MADSILELLYRAYRSHIGIVVRTSDPDRLRQKCYAERKKDPDLNCLSFRISPIEPASRLFIINTRGQNDEEPSSGEENPPPQDG